jgi:hypothetical protein
MAKRPPKEIEFYPDAWERFERAVKVVVKAPPMHRTKKPADSLISKVKKGKKKKVT